MSGFEAQDHPDMDQANSCMHCGLCLPSCPTYLLSGRERSSPRGRIALIRGVAEGRIELDSKLLAQEMDDCLGCLGCVSACPAGVDYGGLLEATRDQLWRHHSPALPRWKRTFIDLLLGMLDRPWLLQWVSRCLWLYQRTGMAQLLARLGGKFSQRWADLHALLPELEWSSARSQLAGVHPAWGQQRGRVGLLLGCVMDVFFVREHRATLRVLQRQGFQVVVPAQQACCGALQAHAGRLQWARQQARRLIEDFEAQEIDCLVVNSAGCSNLLKHYGQLLRDDPQWSERAQALAAKTKDVQEFLGQIELNPPIPCQELSLTYHDACHLAHGQGVREAPRRLLRQLAGSAYRELKEADLCCGSAGTYNLTHPEPASQLLDRKLQALEESGAQWVGVANPGCLLQIRAGLRRRRSSIRAEHPVVLLDQAWSAQ